MPYAPNEEIDIAKRFSDHPPITTQTYESIEMVQLCSNRKNLLSLILKPDAAEGLNSTNSDEKDANAKFAVR